MKRPSLAKIGLLSPLLLCVALLAVGWFLRSRVPYAGRATAHFAAQPPPGDPAWVTAVAARDAVPESREPITPENAARLVQSARWGGSRARSVSYSPDGKTIAIMTSQGPYLYDAETLNLVQRMETGLDARTGVFSPDSANLAFALDDHTIQVRSVTGGRLQTTLLGHDSFIQQLAYSPAGDRLASAAWDGTVRIWSMPDGAHLRTLDGHSDYMQSVTFHPDGAQVAGVNSEGKLFVWRVEDGVEVRTFGKPFLLDVNHILGNIDSSFRFYSAEFSPDGRRLAASASNYTYVWDYPSGRLMRATTPTRFSIQPLRFASNDILITGEGEQYDLNSGAPVRDFDTPDDETPLVAPDPDGTRLAAVDRLGALGLWSLADGSFIKGSRRSADLALPYDSVLLSPDGKTLFAGDSSGAVQIRSLPGGELLHTLPYGDGENPVSSLAVSPDGSLLAAGTWYTATGSGDDGSIVHVWRVADGTLLYALRGHRWIQDLAFSPDGSLLATAGADEERTFPIRLWNMADGQLARELSGHEFTVERIVFSAAGDQLISTSSDDTVRHWDVATGAQLDIRDGIRYNNYPALNAGGTILAARTADDEVAIWDITDPTPLRTLNHDRDHVWSLAFSPDGSLLATGTSSGTLRLWRVSDGVLLATQRGHTDSLTTLAFSRDGSALVTAAWDGTVRFWAVR